MKKILIALIVCLSAQFSTAAELSKIDYVSFTKTYGYIRYYSPNPFTEQWTDYDWANVSAFLLYQYSNNLESLSTIFLSLAPNYTISTEPESGYVPTPKTDTAFCWKYTGGGASPEIPDKIKKTHPEYANYKQYFKELVIAQKGMPIPDSIYSYQIAKNLWLNIPHALAKSQFNKKQTDELLATASRYHVLFEKFMNGRPYENDEFNNTSIEPLIAQTLSSCVEKWNAIQHFYPYYNEDNLQWEQKLKPLIDSTIIKRIYDYHYNELCRTFSSVRDGHLQFVRAVKISDQNYMPMAKMYLPFQIDYIENKGIIMAISSAHKTRLNKYDIIIEINNQPTDSVINHYSQFVSGTTKDLVAAKALTESLRTFIWQHPYILTVNRNNSFVKDTIIASRIDQPYIERNEDSVITIYPNKTIVFKATNKNATYEYFLSNLDIFKKARKIIFDLRGYPNYDFGKIMGHLSKSTIQLPKFVTAISTFPNHKNLQYATLQEQIAPKKPLINKKLVFLIDYKTISWGETVAMSVKYNKLGKLFGTTSAGTNGDITYFNHPVFPMIITGLQTFYPDNSEFHHIGVIPDFEVQPTIKGLVEKRDEILEQALKY